MALVNLRQTRHAEIASLLVYLDIVSAHTDERRRWVVRLTEHHLHVSESVAEVLRAHRAFGGGKQMPALLMDHVNQARIRHATSS